MKQTKVFHVNLQERHLRELLSIIIKSEKLKSRNGWNELMVLIIP